MTASWPATRRALDISSVFVQESHRFKEDVRDSRGAFLFPFTFFGEIGALDIFNSTRKMGHVLETLAMSTREQSECG